MILRLSAFVPLVLALALAAAPLASAAPAASIRSRVASFRRAQTGRLLLPRGVATNEWSAAAKVILGRPGAVLNRLQATSLLLVAARNSLSAARQATSPAIALEHAEGAVRLFDRAVQNAESGGIAVLVKVARADLATGQAYLEQLHRAAR